MLVFVLQWLSFHWEILIMLLCQFPLTFHHIHNGMSCFIALLVTILCDHLTDIPWKNIFKLSASAAASELMYISLIKSIRSSLTHLHRFQLFVLMP